MNTKEIIVIGAGLAGAEAAYQIAKRGLKVKLYEMRPNPKALGHHSDLFAELVCSNSLKSSALENAAGLLKQEMRELDSLIMQVADKTSVPAGQALAVDRTLFAQMITKIIRANPLIEVIHQEVTNIDPSQVTIIASGPLTSDLLSANIQQLIGDSYLYFYDAAAPLVLKKGIDFSIAYSKSRYDKGSGDDYLNLPFTKEEFFAFYQALVSAQRVELKSFEKEKHFEGCLPIEVLASRGFKTLTFGPLKPVGLELDNGQRPFAVVQLRQDNIAGNMYNMVGVQTNLTFAEQERVFKMIPGLKDATFVRYGVMHRNTYLNSPKCLHQELNLKAYPNIFFAGQITGVEGYIESAASGIVAAINTIAQLENKPLSIPPSCTILGSLLAYLEHGNAHDFQPMNANYGVLNSAIQDKKEIAKIALEAIKKWGAEHA